MSPHCAPLPFLGVLTLLLSACSTPGFGPIEYEREVVSSDGLVKLRTYRLGAAFLRPGAQLGDYSKVLVDPVEIAYKYPPRPRRNWNAVEGGNFQLSEQQMERLRRSFQDIFEKTLAKSDIWTLANAPSRDTLRVRAYIVDLVVGAPPDRPGRDRVYLQQSAEMTLILDVSDSETHEALARLKDRRLLRPSTTGRFYESSPVADNSELRTLFRQWARLLTEALDGLHELPEIPPLPRSGDRGKEIAAGTPSRLLAPWARDVKFDATSPANSGDGADGA